MHCECDILVVLWFCYNILKFSKQIVWYIVFLSSSWSDFHHMTYKHHYLQVFIMVCYAITPTQSLYPYTRYVKTIICTISILLIYIRVYIYPEYSVFYTKLIIWIIITVMLQSIAFVLYYAESKFTPVVLDLGFRSSVSFSGAHYSISTSLVICTVKVLRAVNSPITCSISIVPSMPRRESRKILNCPRTHQQAPMTNYYSQFKP